MKLTINTKDDCCKSVEVECSMSEWLVIHKALRILANWSDSDDDKRTAEEMYNAQPMFVEEEEDTEE